MMQILSHEKFLFCMKKPFTVVHVINPSRFTTGESEESQRATKISPRWPTKVFAVECSRKIYAVCKSDPAHFDLALAQKRKSARGGMQLVKGRQIC